MNPPALALSVASALFEQLSGFRGFPKPGLGRDRFVKVFQESVISVDHARAVVATFDSQMPTLREIRDTAYTLRAQFEPPVDQREEWEKQYGKPDPAWSRQLLSVGARPLHAEERKALLWQAIRDSFYYTVGPGARGPDAFWHEAAEKHIKNHREECESFRAQLQEVGWDGVMAVDWLKSMPKAPARQRPVSVPVITQEDIDNELRAQGREPGDGE